MTSQYGDDASRASGVNPSGQPPFGPLTPGAGTQQNYYGGPQFKQPQKKSQTLVLVLLSLAVLAILLLIALVATISLTSSGGKAGSVLATCTEQLPNATSATLRSDGKSIQYGSGEYPDSSDVLMLGCLLEETGAPSAVEARMESTRGLDGTLEAEWDNWSAFWTYHPDAGFDATFTAE
jgi:hypothetical protein